MATVSAYARLSQHQAKWIGQPTGVVRAHRVLVPACLERATEELLAVCVTCNRGEVVVPGAVSTGQICTRWAHTSSSRSAMSQAFVVVHVVRRVLVSQAFVVVHAFGGQRSARADLSASS